MDTPEKPRPLPHTASSSRSRSVRELSREFDSKVKSGGRCHFVSSQSGERENFAFGMFLTIALLRNKIPGRQWIGKHRRPRFVTIHMKKNMIRRLEIEAENEYWLSRPYMTKEQEFCHNQERRQAYFKELVAAAKSKFPEHKYATEHLDHLNVTKKWTSS